LLWRCLKGRRNRCGLRHGIGTGDGGSGGEHAKSTPPQHGIKKRSGNNAALNASHRSPYIKKNL
jgi:hypothetical protein